MHDVNPLDIVETICEGVLVVEPDLTIRFANRSFYDTFAVAPEHTVGRKLYEIGHGQWDIPKLRTTLETIISGQKTIEAFEVENFFPSIGRRIIAVSYTHLQITDKDRVEGSAKEIKGKTKEGAGKVLGDAKLESEGKADEAAGKIQNAVGGVKGTLKGK